MKSLIIALLTTLSLAALGAPPTVDYTPEQRKQMAEMHTKAAACLTSSKSIQECHEEMMKGSSHMGMGMGTRWGCPMMGSGPQPETKPKTTK
jgi:hypothetical protein